MNFSLFLNGIKTGVRQKKRFTVFGLLFMILSGMLIIQGLRLDSYNTNNLVRARGVVVEGDEVDTVVNTVGDEARGIYPLHYGEIENTNVGVISPEPKRTSGGEINWILSDVGLNPSSLESGHFPSERGEALINENYTIKKGDITVGVAAVGAQISLYGEDLTVSGVYSESAVKDLSGGAKNLIYVNYGIFKSLRRDLTSTSVQRIVITADGDYLFGSAMDNREEIETKLSGEGLSIKKSDKLRAPEYREILLQTLFTFFSSLILVALYSYLVVRFRRDEIATLRAIGWSGGEIKQYVLAELFAMVLISYLISLFFSIVGAYYYIGVPVKSILTFLGTLGVAFLALAFGWLIISKGVLKVSPMEAFRKR